MWITTTALSPGPEHGVVLYIFWEKTKHQGKYHISAFLVNNIYDIRS